MRLSVPLLVVPLLSILACKPDDAPIDEDLPETCGAPLEPGPAPIRRLTRGEYNNTVYQLFGDTTQPANAFPPDEEAGGFDNQATALVVSPLLAEGYLTAAENLAATHAPTLMQDLPNCSGGSVDEDACAGDAETFVRTFGKRVYRRPLTDDEVASYVDMFEQGVLLSDTDAYSAQTGVEIVVQTMLQSPHFLYRVEFGMPDPVEGDVVKLTSYEVASRLSYLLWNTMPDTALFEAAERDELQTAEQIAAQAHRMLDTPRAREAVKNFHRQWLQLDDIVPRISAAGRDPVIYPDYYEGLLPLWQAESEAFFEYAIFEENATVQELFTAPYTMMNSELADFYGVSGPASLAFERVDVDPTRYSGFLTHAGIIALHSMVNRSSPIHRGKYVREVLLCQIPPPPPDKIPEPPSVDENQTTREQFAQHSEDLLCQGCHQYMDPIGLGFEHFDGLGRWRDDEWGQPIDASGELVFTDVDGPFNGATELGQMLASSEQVRRCVTKQWFRFGYGRVETEEDTCTMDSLYGEFEAANFDIKELIVALTTTQAFRYRHAASPEGTSP
jgi:hypothetical protein